MAETPPMVILEIVAAATTAAAPLVPTRIYLSAAAAPSDTDEYVNTLAFGAATTADERKLCANTDPEVGEYTGNKLIVKLPHSNVEMILSRLGIA